MQGLQLNLPDHSRLVYDKVANQKTSPGVGRLLRSVGLVSVHIGSLSFNHVKET